MSLSEALIEYASPTLAGIKVGSLFAFIPQDPAAGVEELEEAEFAPMFEACKPALAGKNIALFGSWGWGGGEWMNTWEEDCRSIGANLIADSVICQDEPDDAALAACKALGEAIR